MDNHALIGRCLQLLRSGLSRFTDEHFPGENSSDVATCLKLLAFRWSELGPQFPRRGRTLAHEMLEVRNEWAHQVPFSDEDASRALDSAKRLLEAVGCLEAASQVAALSTVRVRAPEFAVKSQPKIGRVARTPTPTLESDFVKCRKRLLSDIEFSVDPESASYKCLMQRLAAITDQVYGKSEEKQGSIARKFIPLSFGWVNETRIVPSIVAGTGYLQVMLHIGDTKQQGNHFFDLNPTGLLWPEAIAGRELLARPYFKIASPYANAILWICPTPDEARSTHTQRFFADFSGKMLRDEWAAFGAKLSKYLPNWKEQCFIRDSEEKADWDQKITSSNYKYVTFSVSTNLRVLLPYPDCRILDSTIEDSPLAEHYRQILAGVKDLVEGRLEDIGS